jgi:hypothetical protein
VDENNGPAHHEPATAPYAENTNATRHLSAGAYLDEEFCLTALRDIYYQPKRIVAPSYGFDPLTVLGHCLLARRAMVARDAVLLGVLVFATWLSVFALLVLLAVMLTVHVAFTAAAVGRESVTYLREPLTMRGEGSLDADARTRRARPAGRTRPDRREIHSRSFRRLWFENLVAQIIGRVVGLVLRYLTIAATALGIAVASAVLWGTNPIDVDPIGLSPVGPVAPVVSTAGVAALSVLAPVCARVWGQLRLRALVPGCDVEPPLMTDRLAQIADQMDGNTVVYSGYQPFVGSGVVLRRWDLAQRLVRAEDPVVVAGGQSTPEADREFARPPFSAGEIIDHVKTHIQDLADDPVPERGLPSLTVSDKVFVAGTEIANLRPDVSAAELAEIIRVPTAPARYYLACQVVSWRGELVTTVYVHIAVQGKALYVELYVTGLLPCEERFRVIDQVGGIGVKAIARAASRAMVEAPTMLAAAPIALARAFGDKISVASLPDPHAGEVHKGYDYGARVGLREIGASVEERDHMQAQDIIKYGRIIERRVLAAILDFLEDRGVDVTEYRHRALTILNAGAVAISGGTVNVEGDAIGTQNVTSSAGSD